MLKKLTTKGLNKQTKEFEERTANLTCSYSCLMYCIEEGLLRADSYYAFTFYH